MNGREGGERQGKARPISGKPADGSDPCVFGRRLYRSHRPELLHRSLRRAKTCTFIFDKKGIGLPQNAVSLLAKG
jgi:hypothetical protein